MGQAGQMECRSKQSSHCLLSYLGSFCCVPLVACNYSSRCRFWPSIPECLFDSSDGSSRDTDQHRLSNSFDPDC